MKIIVTGGAGFIGSHVVDAYVKAGHKVVVIDNLTTGFKRNINSKARFYKVDIRDAKNIEKIFKKERPAVVNHHAAIAEVVKSLRNPIPTLDVNLLGTANILSAFSAYGQAKKGSRKKFIFASTGGAIYGDPKVVPAPESAPLNTLSPYGLSKLLDEITIKFYARQHDFDFTIFRYSNVYGPRQNPKGEAGVVAIFGGLIKTGGRPTIFGDGKKSRDYIYVYDIATANKLALIKGKNAILNLGTGKLTTDFAVFETVAKHLGFKERPRFEPHRAGEAHRISLDTTAARKILGWKPTKDFKRGVEETFA